MSRFWEGEPAEVHSVEDAASGLRAFVVLDDLRLGPAAGGIRTRAYPSAETARREAAELAHRMTLKCALVGLPAGGGKGVVWPRPGWDRARAFERLGAFVESLGGRFRTAGDLGTTAEDLAAMARQTRWVHADEPTLAAAAGRGVLRCMEAIADRLGASSLAGMRVLVQGCGSMGTAVARAVAGAGAEVLVCELDEARAARVADAVGAEVTPARGALLHSVDILSPCATGGVVEADLARALRARALCGAANGILRDETADRILLERGILHVPDALSSAGAVIDGLTRTLLGREVTGPDIDRLGAIAAEILEESAERHLPATAVAVARARRRLETAGV